MTAEVFIYYLSKSYAINYAVSFKGTKLQFAIISSKFTYRFLLNLTKN